MIRGGRPDDEAAALELVNLHGRAMWGEDTASASEVHGWFTEPERDIAKDFLFAETPDGRLAGVSWIEAPATDRSTAWTRHVLHPELADDRLGDALQAAADRRIGELVAPGAALRGSCAAPDERAAAVFQRHGYALVRHFFRMIAPLDPAPAEPAWPEGLELRPVDPDVDARAIYLADDEAFRDHWGYFEVSFDKWLHWMQASAYDPTLWFVAYDGDEVAGYLLGKTEEGGDPKLGWVEVLGVRRAWRRRGLALALLLHAFGEFRRRGYERVGLGVDGANLTGAVRLYEKAGMQRVRQFEVFEKQL
jgi:mycothiol synthase